MRFFSIVFFIISVHTLSLQADYQMTLLNDDGTQSNQCVKSYNFSNNIESLIKQSSLTKDIYSEEEILTNKVYFGKPVYRKIIKEGDYIVKKKEHRLIWSKIVN